MSNSYHPSHQTAFFSQSFGGMDSYGNEEDDLSLDRIKEMICHFGANLGISQHQVEDQSYYENDQGFCENDQGYYEDEQQGYCGQFYEEEQPNYYGQFQEQEQQDYEFSYDGGYHEDDMAYQQNQEDLYNDGYFHGEEQQNLYEEEHHHYDPNLENDECFYEEEPHYEEFPSEPPQEDLNLVMEMLISIDQRLEQQAKSISEWKSNLAQQATRIPHIDEERNPPKEEINDKYDEESLADSLDLLDLANKLIGEEEVHESCEEKILGIPIEMLGVAIKGIDYEVDYDLNEEFFSDSSEEDEPSPLEENQIWEKEVQVQEVLVEKDLRVENDQICLEEEVNLDGCFSSWEPSAIVEDFEEEVPMKLECIVEDPILHTLPQEKFWRFRLFMEIPIKRSAYDPVHSMSLNLMRGSKLQVYVHSRLDGRKLLWDFKVD